MPLEAGRNLGLGWFRNSRSQSGIGATAIVMAAKSLRIALDLPPILRQMVKTHFSLNGELSHGVVT